QFSKASINEKADFDTKVITKPIQLTEKALNPTIDPLAPPHDGEGRPQAPSAEPKVEKTKNTDLLLTKENKRNVPEELQKTLGRALKDGDKIRIDRYGYRDSSGKQVDKLYATYHDGKFYFNKNHEAYFIQGDNIVFLSGATEEAERKRTELPTT